MSPTEHERNPFEAPKTPLARTESTTILGTTLLEWFISLLIIAVLVALLLPATRSARSPATRPQRQGQRPSGASPAPAIPGSSGAKGLAP